MTTTQETLELLLHVQDGRLYVLEYNSETDDDDDREIADAPQSLIAAVRELGDGVRIVAKYDQEAKHVGGFGEMPTVDVTVDLRDVELAWFDCEWFTASKIPADAVKWAWDFMLAEIDEANASGEW